MRRLFVLVCVLLLCSVSVYSAVPEKTVTAEGIAAGSGLKAHDEALNRAMRRAVEQGVGALIDSESMTQNYQLLDDKIYSQVKGYVRSYSIVSDNKGAGGIYRIRIEAVVALAVLSKDLKALNIIRERKANPRVMILIQESIDGLEQPSELVQAEIEKHFLAKGFPLVDKSQLQMVKERDVALGYDDPHKAAVLGREFGAEIVIVGQAVCNLLESSMPYGVQVFGYTADITAKAIKTDTAELIDTESISATERGSGRIPTANKALGSAGGKLADAVARGILEKWRSEIFNTVSVEVIVSNVQAEDRKILKQDIGAIRGVQGSYERSFNKGVVVMDLTIDGALWKGFEARLLEMPDIKLQLTAKTGNRIELKKVNRILQTRPE